jgi:aminoglycoside phosphotransferase (APT) family kinase protein
VSEANSSEQEILESLADMSRLGPWLADVLRLRPEDLAVRRASTGHTNEMLLVESGDDRWILRRPPRTRSAATAHDMSREYRVMSALDRTDVPHPRMIALCEDDTIIGAPFILMAFVPGITAQLPLPAPFDQPGEAQRELAFALIDSLARIAKVPWQDVGLDGFGRPAGFLERQVNRWLTQLEKYRTRDIPGLDEVARWLDAHRPDTGLTGLVHGDYQWNNVLFEAERPGRVAAVVDWEQSTVGDPLLDLGWLLGLWYEPGETAEGRDASRLFCQLPGLPRRAELAARYGELTGFDLRNLEYYRVLALFKLACVIEGSYARYVKGQSDDPLHATFEVRVPALIARARSIAAGELP